MSPLPRPHWERAVPRTAARALGSVIFEVRGPVDPGWRPGPLPWRLPSGDSADADARRT